VVEVEVVDAPTAVAIELFAAEPASLEAGQSVTLSWNVHHAYTLDLDGRQVPPRSSAQVSPTRTTRYVLTAQGVNGPISRELSVTVRMPRLGKPDRGGCTCGAQPSSPWDSVEWIFLFLALGWLARRRNASYL